MEKLLSGKNAIVYGAGGGLGGGVARAFAREGATVFLAGRTREALDAVASEIKAAGGTAHVAIVDATDEQAVDAHVAEVTKQSGTVDVSFNLITRGDVQQIPLIDMSADDLMRALTVGMRSNFITARSAARQMTKQGSGVILFLDSGSAKGSMPGMGSTGPADAAIDTLMRYLAVELGPSGIRVVGIYTAGVADTLTQEKMDAVAGPGVVDVEAAKRGIAMMSMLRRGPRPPAGAGAGGVLPSHPAPGAPAPPVNVVRAARPGPA